MALTFIVGRRSYNQNNSTTVTTNETDGSTFSVSVGDLLVVWLKHEGTTTTASIADTAGNTWQQGTWRHHANGDLHGIFFWTQATNAHAANVVTVTLAAARASKRLVMTQFRPTAGKVATKAAEYTNEGTSGSPGSGAGTITWTTTEGVALASYSPYNPTTPTSATINGAAATLWPNDPYAPYVQVWYQIVSAGFTGGSASVGVNDVWVSTLIAFSFAAAATPLTIANTAQAQTTDNVNPGVAVTLVIDAVWHAVSEEAPTLTYHPGLNIASTAQTQATDNVGLTQHVALTVANVAQAQATDNVALTQHGILVIANSSQAQTGDNVGLTQHGALVLANTAQAQATDNVGLTQHGALAVANVAQDQTVAAVTLTVGLVIADSVQAQTAAAPVLHLVGSVLVIADSSQAQTGDVVTLGVGLVIADLVQTQATDRVANNPWLANCEAVSDTPTPALGLLRRLNATPMIPTETGDAGLAVRHALSAAPTVLSVTPLTLWQVRVNWLSSCTAVSVTATAQFEGLHPFTAALVLASDTPDTVDLPVVRHLTAVFTVRTATPLLSLWVAGLTGPRGAVRIRFRTR